MSTETTTTILCVLNGILSLSGSFANLLVLLVVLKNSELQKGLNLFIASLCCSDLLICSLAQPMYIYHLVYKTYPSLYYTVLNFLSLVFLHASFNHLAGITFHRMKALSRPYTHQLLVSRRRVLGILGIIWVFSAFLGSFAATKPDRGLVLPYLHIAMILSLIAVFVKIFFMVRQHRSKIASQQGWATVKVQSAAIAYQNEAAKTSAILVGSSIICFLPDVILESLGMADLTRVRWGYTLLFASSAFNPLVFIVRSSQFRAALRKTWRNIES